jgi:hypothetical protein
MRILRISMNLCALICVNIAKVFVRLGQDFNALGGGSRDKEERPI